MPSLCSISGYIAGGNINRRKAGDPPPESRLVFVVCDNVGIAREVFDEAKRLVHESTGLPVENMLMSSTHTHSATSARP